GALVLSLRRLASRLVQIVWTDACRRVRERRGLDKGDDRGTVAALVNGLDTAPELLALIAELVAARTSLDWSGLYSSAPGKEEAAWWREWGIDPAALRKAAEEDRKAKASGKGQPPLKLHDADPHEAHADRGALADRLEAQANGHPRPRGRAKRAAGKAAAAG